MHVVLLAVGALVTLVGGALIRFGLPLDEYGNSPFLVSGSVTLVGGLILLYLALAVRSLNRIAERLDIQPFSIHKADMLHPVPQPRAAAQAPMPVPPPVITPPPVVVPLPVAPRPELRAEPDAAPEPRIDPAPARAPPAGSTPNRPSFLGWLNKPRPGETVARKGAGEPRPNGNGDLDPLAQVGREPAVRPLPPTGNGVKAPVSAGAQVYKSGVIDGMAYTLFTDGSIEAELPQGKIRFATVDALQTYLAGR